MKTYVRGTKTQAQGRPRKAGHVAKSVSKRNRRSSANAASMGGRPKHSRLARSNGAQLKVGRHAGWKVIYERVPRLPGGTRVREAEGKIHIMLDAGTWDRLWSMAKRMKAPHPLAALLSGFITHA